MVRVAITFYLLAASLGVLLRLYLVRPFPWLPLGNAIHAHSHTLFYGWGGLAVFALAFAQLRVQARAVLSAIVALSAATFVAFLHSGYGTPGVVVSAVALPVWAWAGVSLLRALRGRDEPRDAYLRAGVFHLFLSLVAAGVRAAMLAFPSLDPVWPKLAVHGFLQLFGLFLLLSSLGLLAGAAPSLRVNLSDKVLRRVLRLTVPAAWLSFPLGVDVDGPLSWIARASAAWLVVPGALLARELWRAAPARTGAGAALRVTAVWIAAKAGLDLAGALGLAELAVRLHQPKMAYLHLVLLGCVSWPLLLAAGGPPSRGLAEHHVGLVSMLVGLGLLSASAAGLLSGGWAAGQLLAAAGGATIVIGGARRLWPVRTRGAIRTTAPNAT